MQPFCPVSDFAEPNPIVALLLAANVKLREKGPLGALCEKVTKTRLLRVKYTLNLQKIARDGRGLCS